MNSSEARQGKNYKVDRLVLKAMTDEAPKARYQAAKAAGRCKCVEDNTFHFRQRENLDTERMTFTMLRL